MPDQQPNPQQPGRPSPGRPIGGSSAGKPPARPIVHRKATPPPPIVSYEDVVASCGHPEKFGLFEDRKDKFRKDRRKKVTDRPCRACREKKRLEEEQLLAERRAEKQKRAAEAAKTGQTKRANRRSPERLPDGSKFEVIYDAAKVMWNGTLTIGEQSFTGSASGLFPLLSKLDRQYRQTLPGEEPPAS